MSADRRRFLQVIAGGAASGLLVACGGGGDSQELPATIDAGNVKDVPVGTLKAVGGEPAAIARDAKGLYAMTLICTHAACDISQRGRVGPTDIACLCHGSQFDANGAVIHGPAQSPLQHYQVTVDKNGEITIHGDTPVSSDARVMVS